MDNPDNNLPFDQNTMVDAADPAPLAPMKGWTEIALAPSDAVRQLPRLARGRKLFVHCRQEAPIFNKPSHYFPVSAGVPVSLSVALRFIPDAYGNFAARGAMVKLAYADNILFIG